MSGRLRSAVLLTALVLAVTGMWRAYDGGRPSEAERAAAIYETLRCPTCTGESIADSQAPLSSSMRSIVRRQVAEGRTDAEVRAWFAERYGTSVLLSPPARGATVVLWLLPGAVVITAVAWWAVRQRRRPSARQPVEAHGGTGTGTGTGSGVRPAPMSRSRGAALLVAVGALAVGAGTLVVLGTGGSQVGATDAGARDTRAVDADDSRERARDPALEALRTAVDRAPRDAGTRLALGRALDDRGDLEAAAVAYREALRIQPDHPAARLRLAFVMVRTDRPGRATVLLRALLEDDPRNAEAVLLLGTVQRQQGDRAWRSTLRRFLGLAPDHLAASRVRDLLGGRQP